MSWLSLQLMQSEIRIQNEESYRFEQVQFNPLFTLFEIFLAMFSIYFLLTVATKNLCRIAQVICITTL